MLKIIKNWLVAPASRDLALAELEEAKRELLRAQTNLDYAKAVVAYHQARITRLTQATEEKKDA